MTQTLAPLDLLIVGAGIGGIDMGHHVVTNFPDWNWEIVDSNTDLGGTWTTFTYPGIRSDSDMATFSLPWKPWKGKTTLGDGADIREYLRDAAREDGFLDRIRLNTWVKSVNFDTASGLWEVTTVHAHDHGPDDRADAPAENLVETVVRARRIHLACGYYNHRDGHLPHYPGQEDFTGNGGTLIHAQAWKPEEQGDVTGKKIIIIGSGATAVTLLPALAKAGAHVTMLQRTPTWIAALPDRDNISAVWTRLIPKKSLAHKVARANHIIRDMTQWYLARRTPFIVRGALHRVQRLWLTPEQIKRDFTPPYNPWDQRVCKAPNGDIFRAIKDGTADVVTATIDRFVPEGVRLSDGRVLEADTVISATGLQLQMFGGASASVDGVEIDLSQQVAYRGVLLSGLPNVSFTVGYLNQSWTTRADLTARYVVRLWRHMADRGLSLAAPVTPGPEVTRRELLEFDAGYIKRGQHLTPRQGDRSPWLYRQDYLAEWPELSRGDVTEEMVFDGDATVVASRLESVGDSESAGDAGGVRGVGVTPAGSL
ncbi:MAG: NAD(P)/FAD-dependent oxidoreductase [Corynebacterium variabile]|uniref:flavin-containing monooxygenase n=1 Tax=Corynebacterium variabile TaxID=1727 RepID=UPI002648DD3D|nr:NAD(P)/FAD-dependent oxidoreductase [Corynebacterium variabile]MDN6662488.1 NAD(P)/FAD-dependent oxidoreductase [Corynebacterium variabile]